MRNKNLEVYRVALMFGICFLHCVSQGGHVRTWLANILLSCVDGFVFISGYFGIRFMPSKILRLYGMAVMSGLLLLALGTYFNLMPPFGTEAYLKLVKNSLWGFWFLNAYVFMMCLTPLVDKVFEVVPRKQWAPIFLPVLALPFVWTFASELPIIGCVLPKTSGLGSYSGTTLLGVYICARICRNLDIERYLSLKRIALLLPVFWFFTAIGFGDYASLFTVGLCALMFYLFKAAKIPRMVGSACTFLAPSMFCVYMLHTNFIGFPLIRRLEDMFVDGQGMNVYLTYPICACIIFFGALLLDMPRRMLGRLFRAPLKRIYLYIDTLYMNLIDADSTIRGRKEHIDASC